MAMTLITTNTLSSSSESVFTSGIDSTYKLYIFKCIDIHSSADEAHMFFQANVAGQSGYNEVATTTLIFFSIFFR